MGLVRQPNFYDLCFFAAKIQIDSNVVGSKNNTINFRYLSLFNSVKTFPISLCLPVKILLDRGIISGSRLWLKLDGFLFILPKSMGKICGSESGNKRNLFASFLTMRLLSVELISAMALLKH